ncbi:hypothetical protein ACQCVP_08705 [Rossellomorea vietnamensis]|uniref:hypothetical protein n=1 Tax=Rossellomorea vietnamensis TaxID=218284 RepID=UPI003CFB16B6
MVIGKSHEHSGIWFKIRLIIDVGLMYFAGGARYIKRGNSYDDVLRWRSEVHQKGKFSR